MSGFSSKTLQGNWYEDRLHGRLHIAARDVAVLDTTARVVPPDLSHDDQFQVYFTHKQLTDHDQLTAHRPKPSPQRKMVTAANLPQAIEAHNKAAGAHILLKLAEQQTPSVATGPATDVYQSSYQRSYSPVQPDSRKTAAAYATGRHIANTCTE